jgi:hypothetical protein
MGILESGRSERRKRDVEKAVEHRTQLRDKFIGDINKQLMGGQEVNEEETNVYDISSEAEEEK